MDLKLNKEKLLEWMDSKYQPYATRYIGSKVTNRQVKLMLGVSLNRNFRVELGTETLYDGRDVNAAIETFNNELN